MIKFNEEYSFERDQFCWHLHQSVDGKDKDGNPKKTIKTTYHADLTQICFAILDRSAGKCTSFAELPELMKSALDNLICHAAQIPDIKRDKAK